MAWKSVSKSVTRLAGTAFVSVLLMTVAPQPGFTQQAKSASDFLKDQSSILPSYPNGGPGLVAQIRDLLVADPTNTLDPVIKLLNNANKDQKNAIAAGLAQAGKILAGRKDQAAANKIQQAVLDTKDQDVVLAFAGAAGDQPIGAGGGAGAGSAGASGGQTTGLGNATGTGAAQAIDGSSTPTSPFSYTSSVSGGSTTTNGASLTNLTVSVSSSSTSTVVSP